MVCYTMVRLFGLEIRRTSKGESPISRHVLTDEERESGYQLRAMRMEQKRMQQEIALMREQSRLEEARSDLEDMRSRMYGDDDEEEEDDSLTKMLLPILMAGKQQPQQQQTTPVQVNLTDDEIKNIIAQVPKKYLKLAKKMDNSTIEKYIRMQQPNVSQDTINRAISMVKV